MVGEQLELDFSAPLPSLPQLWTPDDIFNSADPAVIADFKEDNRVERKRSRISQKNLSEYASMWANTQPYGGIVFLGIENDGTITGCGSTEQSHINKLETVSRLCPDAKMEFKRVAVKNQTGKDDFVIVLRIYFREDKLVETTDGSAFVREGDQKRRLTEAEKREIRLNRGELDCESEPANLRFPEDFDLSLLNEYRSFPNSENYPIKLFNRIWHAPYCLRRTRDLSFLGLSYELFDTMVLRRNLASI